MDVSTWRIIILECLVTRSEHSSWNTLQTLVTNLNEHERTNMNKYWVLKLFLVIRKNTIEFNTHFRNISLPKILQIHSRKTISRLNRLDLGEQKYVEHFGCSSKIDEVTRWLWCWWHRYVGDLLMVTDLRCWGRIIMLVTFFVMLVIFSMY